jgi:hypothetical protein
MVQRSHTLDPDTAVTQTSGAPAWIEVAQAAVPRAWVLEPGGRGRDHRAT